MSEPLSELIRMRISQRLDEVGLTAISAATQAGLPRDTIRNLFRKESALPRADTLVAIAKALQTSVSFLLGEDAASSSEQADYSHQIIVMADIGPRLWTVEKLPLQQVIQVKIPHYEYAYLFAYRVATDDYLPLIRQGAYVIMSPAIHAGYRVGDIVLLAEKDDNKRRYTLWTLGFSEDDRFIITPVEGGEPVLFSEVLGGIAGPIVALLDAELRGSGRGIHFNPLVE